MIKEYKFSFEELGIVSNEIAEILGFEKESVPELFAEIIEKALSEAPQHCNIRGGFRVFDSEECDIDKHFLKIRNSDFNPPAVVMNHFKKAESFALFIATSGAEISEYSNTKASEGDHLWSYVLDIIGTVTVEKAADKIQLALENTLSSAGLSITDRFSPGYCGWLVDEQQKLFSLLPPGFCNITLSESSLMSPVKSVSGVFGIGKNLKQHGNQCFWCNDKNCIYGNIKRNKKRKKKQ